MKLAKYLHTISKAVVVLTLTAASIQAGVIYNFVGMGIFPGLPNEPVGFTLTVPNFVNPPMGGLFAFPGCAQFDSSTNCDPAGLQAFAHPIPDIGFSAEIIFSATNRTQYSFFLPSAAFGAPGVYSADASAQNPGTLTVSSVPEPNSILLVLTGAWLCGFLRVRNRRRG